MCRTIRGYRSYLKFGPIWEQWVNIRRIWSHTIHQGRDWPDYLLVSETLLELNSTHSLLRRAKLLRRSRYILAEWRDCHWRLPAPVSTSFIQANMNPSADISVFFDRHLHLLQEERDAEIEQNAVLLSNCSPKLLEKRGLAVLNLMVMNIQVGMGGRKWAKN